jgi:hypothetical protein
MNVDTVHQNTVHQNLVYKSHSSQITQQVISMQRSSLFATIALVGLATTLNLPAQLVNPASLTASAADSTTQQRISGTLPQSYLTINNGRTIAQTAAETKDATGLTPTQKIEKVTKNKGQFGGGDQLRRFFFGDLEPLGVQPGGAGMVVNLYNKATDTTFAYCATFDVVVAVKAGKVTQFAPGEVK